MDIGLWHNGDIRYCVGYPRVVVCCICGIENADNCGIPVDSETAEIVSNDFDGEWGAVPACRECHDKHAAGEFVGTYPNF